MWIGGSEGLSADSGARWNKRRAASSSPSTNTRVSGFVERCLRRGDRAAPTRRTERIAVLHAAARRRQRREDIKHAFNSEPGRPSRCAFSSRPTRPARGLTCSGTASDLFHFDLPWNPEPPGSAQRPHRPQATARRRGVLPLLLPSRNDRRTDVLQVLVHQGRSVSAKNSAAWLTCSKGGWRKHIARRPGCAVTAWMGSKSPDPEDLSGERRNSGRSPKTNSKRPVLRQERLGEEAVDGLRGAPGTLAPAHRASPRNAVPADALHEPSGSPGAPEISPKDRGRGQPRAVGVPP